MQKKFLLVFILALGYSLNIEGQEWLLGGNGNTGPDGLTSTLGNNQLGSTLDTDILLIQNNTERILLTNGTYSDPVLGNQNVTRLGYSIQDGVSTPVTNPFSIHHLGEQTSTVFKRTWFNVGTTYGINTDLMYVGLKKNPEDDGTEERTDAVIAWGDNSIGSQTGPDVLRFIRLQDVQSGSSTPSHTDEGQEVGRFMPNGNFGVGNFSSNGLGLNDPPTQRLDVDGAARFRQLPVVSPDALILGYHENTQDSVDLTLTHLDFSGDSEEYLAGDGTWQTLLNNTACDWDIVGNDLCTGYAGACNDGSVGIGVSGPIAKLHVEQNVGTIGGFGAYVKSGSTGSGINYGTLSQVTGGNGARMAVYGLAVVNQVGNFQTNPRVVGVWGEAQHNQFCGYSPVGVLGTAVPYGSCQSLALAGLFEGDVCITGLLTCASDEMLKTDVESIVNSVEILGNIQPKTYQFLQEEYSMLNLAGGQHFGVLAQELEQVLPDLVHEVTQPAELDEEGAIITESFTYKTVNYVELIPLLIQATNEQQTTIESQNLQIEELESSVQTLNENVQMLADLIQSCCSIDVELKNAEQGPNIQLLQDGSPVNELGQNFPNPFESSTTIAYQVACNCMATIRIMDHTGKTIQVLVNETKAAGNYQVEWNASDLASGMYYYSLEVDGQELVRKAIKL